MEMSFAPTVIADIVLAVLALEGAVLLLRRRGRALDIVAALAPGLFLTLAVRSALAGAPWTHAAAFLALSGPAHLIDMSRRGFFSRAPLPERAQPEPGPRAK